MPSRILREGILTSEGVNRLSCQAELLYRRLMSIVDDYGRYYAANMMVRAACYPLQLDKVTDHDIGKWLVECEKQKLVVLYQNGDGKRYLQLHNFKQKERSRSRFPEMQGRCGADAGQMQDICTTSVPQVTSICPANDPQTTELVGAEQDKSVKKSRKARFCIPTVEEVTTYMTERNWRDPEKQAQTWWDSYQAKDWKIGKSSMSDWQAAVRTWEKNGVQRTTGSGTVTKLDATEKFRFCTVCRRHLDRCECETGRGSSVVTYQVPAGLSPDMAEASAREQHEQRVRRGR